MTTVARFAGSIPRVYDRDLGPFLFRWSAARLGLHVVAPGAERVLEVACGTGLATEGLRDALPRRLAITATDLNEDMLAEARRLRGTLPGVEFVQADAHALPFADATFDAVVCQFGLMFFPEKRRALREALRVLRPGGQIVFSVWGSLDENPAIALVHDLLRRRFPDDPPRFLETPFGLHDPCELTSLFARAGVCHVGIRTWRHVAELPDARGPARGLIRGTPGVLELRDRPGVALGRLVDEVEAALGRRFGHAPFVTPLLARVVHGVKGSTG